VHARGDVSERFGGTNNTRLVASAPIVIAWRTAGSLKTNDYYGELLWKKSGAPMVVSTNLARELSLILLDERTYYEVEGAPKSTLSWPCVMMSFSDDKKYFGPVLLFRDNSIAAKVGTEKFGLPLLVDSNIDPSRAKILAIIKKIFPRGCLHPGIARQVIVWAFRSHRASSHTLRIRAISCPNLFEQTHLFGI
jgi:hypothetical protein